MTVYRIDKSPHEYRKMASECRQRSIDSFDRCDTDGYLSQWAADETARVYDLCAELALAGGKCSFTVLADLDGNRVNARPIHTRYNSTCWMILDDQGRSTGQFAPWKPQKPETLAKRGYREIDIELPAVVMTGSSKGSLHLLVYPYPIEWLGWKERNQ